MFKVYNYNNEVIYSSDNRDDFLKAVSRISAGCSKDAVCWMNENEVTIYPF